MRHCVVAPYCTYAVSLNRGLGKLCFEELGSIAQPNYYQIISHTLNAQNDSPDMRGFESSRFLNREISCRHREVPRFLDQVFLVVRILSLRIGHASLSRARFESSGCAFESERPSRHVRSIKLEEVCCSLSVSTKLGVPLSITCDLFLYQELIFFRPASCHIPVNG